MACFLMVGTVTGVQASVIESAEHVIRVAGEFREGQKQSGMVLERTLPLLQQEEEFRADKGIHEGTTERKNTG